MTATHKSGRTNQQNYRIYLVINTVGYVGIIVHLALIPLFYWLNLASLSFLNLFSSVMWISAWFINKLGRHNPAIALMTTEVILHTLLVVPTVGWHAGFQYYLFPAIPFTLFNNKLEGNAIILISIALCMLFLLLCVYTHDQLPIEALSAELIKIINIVNIVISFTALCIVSYYFRLASLSLEQELETLAHTDPLTGLYNRRRMADFLAQQGSKAELELTDLAIVFVDIDHFKKINDNYGHDIGDKILRSVAGYIKQHLRKGDTLARWGGEEFLILLPNTDLNGAQVLAEKMRKAVAEHGILIGDREYSVTLTFGICQHQIEHPIESSIKFADIALYRGKLAGRNCVMCYS